MKIMLAQCMPRVGDISGNVAIMKNIMADAESQACEMVVFPELVVTG